MARPRTYNDAARTQAITVRVTKNTHSRLAMEASQAGLSVSGLAERYIAKGSVRIEGSHHPDALCPVTLAELKRIGGALDCIAAGARKNAMPPAAHVAGTLRDLVRVMVQDEILRKKTQALASRTDQHDS
ncbi:MAG: hypothetical protein K8F62_00830, partial [Pseudorhodoplanes sp.]|nr:hypothetical protein [Pseudorhodoplanes sp.]